MFDDILKEFSDYLHSHPDIKDAEEIEIEYLQNVKKIVGYLFDKHKESLQRLHDALRSAYSSR